MRKILKTRIKEKSVKKEKNITEIILNSIRMRVIQYLMLHEKGTTSEIGQSLSDVPKASLYRHIKILAQADLIKIVEEKKVRGTIECTYEINKEAPLNSISERQAGQVINSALLSIMGSFHRYFEKETISPAEDMLFLSSATLLLSDEEFKKFLEKIGAVYQEVLENQPGESRKMRKLTFISEPSEN